MSKLLTPVLGATAVLGLCQATEAKAYTCNTPAICRAICGAPTCGSMKASKAQQQNQASKPKLSTAPAAPQR